MNTVMYYCTRSVSQHSSKYDNQLTNFYVQQYTSLFGTEKSYIIPANIEIQLLRQLLKGDSPVQVIVNHPISNFHEKWQPIRTHVVSLRKKCLYPSSCSVHVLQLCLLQCKPQQGLFLIKICQFSYSLVHCYS